ARRARGTRRSPSSSGCESTSERIPAPDRSESGANAPKLGSWCAAGRQIGNSGALKAISRLARRLLCIDRLRNVLLPPRETFCWTETRAGTEGPARVFFNGGRPHLLANGAGRRSGGGHGRPVPIC